MEALYPKPKLSQPGEEHKIYPYLLKDVEVTRVNQVWSTDITYIRMAGGFVLLGGGYGLVQPVCAELVGVGDDGGRFLYRGIEAGVSVGGSQEIFNTDQGSQFTSEEFTGELNTRGIPISMDGRGRCFDNIFIERLWRSLNPEKSTCETTRWCPMREGASETGSGSTTNSDPIRVWTTGHRQNYTGGKKSEAIRKEALPNLGALPPNPRGLTLWGQNDWITMNALERRIRQRRGATRAPTQAPEWHGAAPVAPRNQTRQTITY